MMITWQFENAFKNLGEYFENPRFFLVFRGNRVGSVISHRQESLCVCVGGEAKKNLPWRIFVTASFFSFLTSLPGNKERGGNKNITVLWVIMLLLSRHNQNPP